MHPVISKFSNNLFYRGNLHDGLTPQDRELPLGSLPGDEPVVFINVFGREQQQGTSKCNSKEAHTVADILGYIGRKSVSWEEIGIITPYSYVIN